MTIEERFAAEVSALIFTSPPMADGSAAAFLPFVFTSAS
jgi:hypothetical protein